MKRITILLTKYCDWVSSIIYYVGGRGYTHAPLGLVCAVFQIPISWKYHYICFQFVAEMLADTKAVPLAKAKGLYLPNHLCPELERFQGLKDIVYDPI